MTDDEACEAFLLIQQDAPGLQSWADDIRAGFRAGLAHARQADPTRKDEIAAARIMAVSNALEAAEAVVEAARIIVDESTLKHHPQLKSALDDYDRAKAGGSGGEQHCASCGHSYDRNDPDAGVGYCPKCCINPVGAKAEGEK